MKSIKLITGEDVEYVGKCYVVEVYVDGWVATSIHPYTSDGYSRAMEMMNALPFQYTRISQFL